MLDTLRALAISAEFTAGLRTGLGVLVVGAVSGVLWRWRRRSLFPSAGVLAAGGTLATLPVTRSIPTEIWLGVILLAAGALAAGALPARLLTDPLLAAPGAFLVAYGTELPGSGWIPPFVLATILAAAPLVATFDRRHPVWGPPLLALSALGVLSTVPETEEALVFAGVILPLALLGWPARLASLGGVGSYVVVGVALWMIPLGGYARSGSIVGAAAALGLLVMAPLVWGLSGSTLLDRFPRDWRGTFLAGLLHLVVVYLAARWVGLERDPLRAAWMALGVWGLAGIALWVGRPTPR